MAKPAVKIDRMAEHWKKEINELINASKDAKDTVALKCFERAMRPYLENPETLRTLLGKIAAADVG